MGTARYEKLCELSGRWVKNKEAIGFSCDLQVTKDHRITYLFSGCPRKYRKSLTRLTDQFLKEGMRYVADSFSFPVKDKKEKDNVQDFLECRMPDYLCTLLESRPDFEREVSSDAAVLQFSSIAASLENRDGAWMNWKGEELDPDSGCWITKGGESVSDSASAALWSILSGKTRRKKFHAV